MPTKTSRKFSGGYLSHKPGCTCRFCEARRRSTETLVKSTGLLPEEVESLSPAKRRKLIKGITAPVLSVPNATPQYYVQQWMLQKTLDPGITVKIAAQRMGIVDRTLHRHIKKGLKEGWLQFDDPMEKLEHEIIPKVVTNISELLDKKDKYVTMET